MHPAIHRFLTDRFLARDGVPGVSRHLANLRANEWLPPAELQRLQLDRLKRLLVHARDNCPFYTERFATCGFDPEGMASVEDMEGIPPLTKHDIIEHRRELEARNFRPDEVHESMSGGTTGHVVYFTRDNASLPIKEAGIFRYEQWAGWEFGQWMGAVWPAVIDHPQVVGTRQQMRNWLSLRYLLMAFVSEDRDLIRDSWGQFVARRVRVIRAFPGALMSVARWVEEESPPLPPLTSIISTGELLLPEQRETFERVFGCPVIDSYRSRETGPMAQQCEQLGGLHVSDDLCLVEVDTARAVEAGHGNQPVGPLLITDLFNYGMPLIRYEIGDLGSLDPEPCPCGRSLSLLRNIGGRLTDILYTVDHRPLSAISMLPNFINILEEGNQVQLVQRDYTDLLVRLTPPRLDETKIVRMLEQATCVFGEGIRVSYEYVDEIPLLASGKYRLLINEIPAGDLP